MLSNKKILIVSDSEMNSLKTTTLLKKYGAIILEADSSMDAIKLLSSVEFDLIVIDIQMMELDGRQAVSSIKQSVGTLIPIIFLTTTTLEDDMEQYFKIGINDYLSKPFTEKNLLDKITFYIEKSQHEIITIQSIQISSPPPLYDLSSIKLISRGDKSFLKKLIHIFVTQTPLQVEAMKEKYLEADYKAMSFIAHKIKPSIDNMGIASLKEPIREIEQKGKLQMDDGTIPYLLETIKITINQVVCSLKEFE